MKLSVWHVSTYLKIRHLILDESTFARLIKISIDWLP